ncbi:hypothetical protein TRICI_004800 [Trichomonascus ciferrii]|uniref:Chromatin-remodeling ATPase INO80 n=1 Tax=Trichomonascus ciferrii TaxID=44093 RepID=A0A642UZF4_9ASCO|nr:hypothetical protein TRICI_004800 [Trichomonascus ciferrii]
MSISSLLSSEANNQEEAWPKSSADEDMRFNLHGGLDDPTVAGVYKYAAAPEFENEKARYLRDLHGRIDNVVANEQGYNESYREDKAKQTQDRAFLVVDGLRKQAHKDLHDTAMARVTKQEEADLKEKRRLLKRMERQRKRAEKEGASGEVKKEATTDEKEKKPKRRSERATKRKVHSLEEEGLGEEGTPKSKQQKIEKQAKAKPPSQKEIKAIARLYNTTYDGIWKDMARRDASKVHKTLQTMSNMRQSNARKTAVLAAKEARRWQFRTNKNFKDLQAKARRGMREMLAFWKRNEREEREQRKKAEKEALDQAKKEEELRESRRQARKLNFLITQTELYTHFIGKKISNEEENKDEDGKASKELDFDNADDAELNEAAKRNAQLAVRNAQEKARSFTNNKEPEPTSNELKDVDIDSGEMNFQNPTSLGDIQIPQPKMLSCQLKEYQIKGLNWLANLYEQGINGILADEMGLGKTVQSISVMAYLAETHNIWGPFLVIAPASTLHNWQQEISKFIPDFKALPYWGNSKDRKVLRKFWDRKQLTYTKDSPFHVLITSYQLVVADAQYFQRIRWQYMILDEAQAIKSSNSARWKSLLDFQCRNRLLLTGTPIQNSMHELWALLHFIMPSLFDSHEEFSDWFSKDIESHATTNSQLNEQQLKRLHMILKPFMLRRVKKNVQQELGDKVEVDVYCDLTNRQRVLYKMLRSQINMMELIERATSGSDESNQSLMNLVMQFRKVCNHPDLFERADVRSAFNFATFADTAQLNRDGPVLELAYSARNLIEYSVPKLFYRDGGFLEVPSWGNDAATTGHLLQNTLNIWNPDNIRQRQSNQDAFNWVSFSGTTPGQVYRASTKGVYERAVEFYKIYGADRTPESRIFAQVYDEDDDEDSFTPGRNLFLISESSPHIRFSLEDRILGDLLTIGDRYRVDKYLHVTERAFDSPVLCPPISMSCSDRTMTVGQEDILFSRNVRASLSQMTLDQEWDLLQKGVKAADFPASNLFPSVDNERAGFTTIRMPSMAKFVTQSGKLAKLDQLLTELKANDHRVLIYFQMTKMMDLMEEYLTYRQYKYCRLDGSSKLSDRRDIVNDWQTKPELFVFLLSTRAGGLGINLTAADTVIFYDSDWNPTIDSQAMDRAHRLGQTKQVTVYRLLVKGTIEERMRDRAKQKMHVQQVVMEGGGGENVDFQQKPGREVAFWLLDDDDAVDEVLRQKKEEKEKQQNDKGKNKNKKKAEKKKELSLEEMYHEGEGNFDESNRPSELATPVSTSGTATPVNKKPKK